MDPSQDSLSPALPRSFSSISSTLSKQHKNLQGICLHKMMTSHLLQLSGLQSAQIPNAELAEFHCRTLENFCSKAADIPCANWGGLDRSISCRLLRMLIWQAPNDCTVHYG
ncbi:hypothetical protein GOP47_0010869 [Adiantum capillus-veneris]|uniref:Uncharacterized protein n=1 Tax=Adiantum capillus-veneris TaxID=13818 RepID=A0A9D4UVS0_ADICA|nr:hypothetical protein GOP47_0010869 [Adiantum capillus-veneris]